MLINVKYPHNFDLSKDTVRPDLDMAYRLNKGREVYKYLNEDEIVAVVCVAYTNKIPTTIESLHSLSRYHAKIVVPYTVWSLKGGFGATIIFSLIDHLKKERPEVERVVTLSPKTTMAYKFHTRNGAKQIATNSESDNYEYFLN